MAFVMQASAAVAMAVAQQVILGVEASPISRRAIPSNVPSYVVDYGQYHNSPQLCFIQCFKSSSVGFSCFELTNNMQNYHPFSYPCSPASRRTPTLTMNSTNCISLLI